MFTPASILAAVDNRRAALSAALGRPITYAEVGDAVELHPAVFSRLKKDMLPSEESIARLAAWVGNEADLHCNECETLETEDTEESVEESEVTEEKTVRAVFARGRLSDSEDPTTQTLVNRVRELLAEGAVGVSVMLDLHPGDAEIMAKATEEWFKDETDAPYEDFLPEGFVPRTRIRHTAIVDTPAFADARLTLNDDGTVEGVVTFENEYTGDLRLVENIDLESTAVPSPILFDRTDGDHSGEVVGYLDSFEWVERPPTSHRTVLDDEAVTASLAPLQMPAQYFVRTAPAAAAPITISQPDAQGYRVIEGLAAPKGVCHRGSMSCFTLPTMDERDLDHFHTGAALGLDNGETLRVGAMTIYGGHIDPALAKQGVDAGRVNTYRDNANQVFALVRAFPTKFGLWVRGIIPPDVTESTVLRALACAPSVELWPVGRGKRALTGIHLVPRPAWPVVASVGSAEIVSGEAEVVLAEADEADEVVEAVADTSGVQATLDAVTVLLKGVDERVATLTTLALELKATTDAILALQPVDDIIIE